MTDLISDSSLVAAGTATGGILLGDATPDAAGEFGYTTGFRFFGENSEDLYLEFPAADTAEFDTGSAVSLLQLDDMDFYLLDDNNDGNPVFKMGSSAAEQFSITVTYEAGGQLVESVTFASVTADTDADDGEIIFSVDGATIMTFDDGGANLASGLQYQINNTQISSANLSDGAALDPDILSGDAVDNNLIDHEIGGLEANVSAYSGLVAIAGGATAEVDEKSELEAQIGDVSDFAEADGDSYSGTHDFTSATLNTGTISVATLLDVNEDIDIDLDGADEEINITQASATGTEDAPLIFIDDDRTGDTASEFGEATIEIDAEGVYAMHFLDGFLAMGLDQKIEFGDNAVYIFSDDDGYLDLEADTGIRITAPTDWGDEDQTSIDKLEGYDNAVYIDMGADGIIEIEADTGVQFGSAGVQFLDDGDGAITLKGLGNGADEDLTFNFDDTADSVVISTSTGVLSINMPGIALQAPMEITAADADGEVLTTADLNTVRISSGAGDWTLPDDSCDAATGNWITVIANAAHVASIESADTSDQFYLTDGTGIGANEELDTGGTAFDSCTVMCVAANTWLVVGERGTCADGGAKD